MNARTYYGIKYTNQHTIQTQNGYSWLSGMGVMGGIRNY
jgi:hypothetical protein